MRKIDEPRHLCITDLFEMEEFQFFRANNLLTPCAFVHKKCSLGWVEIGSSLIHGGKSLLGLV